MRPLIKTVLVDGIQFYADYGDFSINFGVHSVEYRTKEKMEAKMKFYAPLNKWEKVRKQINISNVMILYLGIGIMISVLLATIMYAYFN